MPSATSPGADAGDECLESALKDLGFALKSLQLYPPSSPVVRTAVERSYDSLVPMLDRGRLTLEVAPRFLRCRENEIGPGNALVEHLSQKLHGHGFARIHFDPRVDLGSLQRLAELLAVDRGEYDERGGIDVVFTDDRPTGIHAEFLELDRLFDDDATDEVEDIWVALLQGFSAAAHVEDVDWAALANNAERLQEFVAWMADNIDAIAQRTGYESIDVYKFVLEHVGGIAAGLGSEHVNFLVLAVRRIFDRLDPETLVELLTDPFEVEIQAAQPPAAGSMTLTDFLSGAETPGPATGSKSEAQPNIDITQVIACGLDPSQVKDLILHTMRTRKSSSTRLYGLFSRLMDGREDRTPVARRVRGLLEQEMTESEGDDGLLENWPRLADVLEGEAPERFIDSSYDMALRALLADDSLKGIWDVDRLRPRLVEMKPSFVVQRKALVLADVLEIEEDEERYQTIARELEKALHELVVHDQYDLALQLLLAVQSTVDDTTISEAKRDVAAQIIDGFYKPEVLRQLVRNALARSGRDSEAIVRIIQHRIDEAVPVLLDTLADESTRRLRQRLLHLLAALGNDVLEAAVARLDDERWYFVRNLLLLLGGQGDQEQLARVAPLTKHPDIRVRREAVEAVTKLGGVKAPDLLLAAADDRDEEVRVAAIHGLGFHPSAPALERLRSLLRLSNLRGQNTAMIKTAAIALGRLKDTDSKARLLTVAKKPWIFTAQRQPVREAAVWALDALASGNPGAPPESAALRQIRPGKRTRRPGAR